MDRTDSRETHSEAQTRAFAAELATQLGAGDVVALIGPLGAGKTAFVRGLAEALGLAPDERVSSPSYALVNRYALADEVRGAFELVHLDLYRIEGDDALEAIGFDELGPESIVVVEWPEHAPHALAVANFTLRFEDIGADARRIELVRRSRG